MAQHTGYEHSDRLTALENRVESMGELLDEAEQIVGRWVTELEAERGR